MVEERRQKAREEKMRREVDALRKEQCRQEMNILKFAEMQDDMQAIDLAIAAAERDEMSAVSRLQNSQSVRAEIISQLDPNCRSSSPFGGGAPASPSSGAGLPEIAEEEDGAAESAFAFAAASGASLGRLGGIIGSAPHSPSPQPVLHEVVGAAGMAPVPAAVLHSSPSKPSPSWSRSLGSGVCLTAAGVLSAPVITPRGAWQPAGRTGVAMSGGRVASPRRPVT